MKILIVDDSPTMRHVIKNLLAEIGFRNTAEAEDGVTALPMLQDGGYDLLITDWNMPVMQGIDLLSYVRVDVRLSGLPVLMITAEQKPAQIAAAEKAGISGYLVKPFTAQALREKLEMIFATTGS